MNAAGRQKMGKGMVETVLDATVSEQEMDGLLAERLDEVNTKLKEAREERERGEFAPLEPLHVVLRAGRERLRRKTRR